MPSNRDGKRRRADRSGNCHLAKFEHLSAGEFSMPADYRSVLNSFGVICFGLVGLELASVMGDEKSATSADLPGAVAWAESFPALYW
jgi:hypothetical protein